MAVSTALRRKLLPFLPRTHYHFSTLSTQSNPASTPTLNANPTRIPITLLRSTIRSESDPDRIVDLFQSSTNIPRFHDHHPLYQVTLHKLSRLRRPDLIHTVLSSQLSDPKSPKSEGFFICILSLYSSSGMLDRAVEVFDKIPQRTDRSFCALLTAFLEHRRFDLIRENFSKFPGELGISPGVGSYNVYVKALCEDGEMETACRVLDEMVNAKGLVPDIVTYNTVLCGCLKTGDEDWFEEILKEISSRGVEPDVATYNYRISMFCRRAESFKGEELLDVMVSKGMQPNWASFSSVIEGFCREADVGSAVRVFKRMRVMKRVNGKKSVSPNPDTYTVLIRSLVEKGEFGLGFEICKECLGKKFVPPFEVVKGLIEGLVKNAKVEEAKDVVKKMKVVVKGDAADAWKKLESALAL